MGLDSGSLAAGNWWRFSGYEIRDGYIRPEPGARLTAYRVKTEARFELYEGLLALAQESENENPNALTPPFQKKLLGWCADHGLLGLLLQEVVFVAFGPRAYRLTDDGRVATALTNATAREWITVRRRFDRVQADWYAHYSFPDDYTAHDQDVYRALIDSTELTLVEDIPSNATAGGPTLVAGSFLDHPSFWVDTLGETWHRFFPDVPASKRHTYAFPAPRSSRFWEMYAEPIGAFLTAARLLSNTVAAYNISLVGPTLSPEFLFDYQRRSKAHRTLTTLLNTCAPEISQLEATARPRAGLVAPSLLGIFGLVVYETLLSGLYPRECRNEKCHRLFVPEASPKQEYHSVTCRETARKRRQRALSHKTRRVPRLLTRGRQFN